MLVVVDRDGDGQEGHPDQDVDRQLVGKVERAVEYVAGEDIGDQHHAEGGDQQAAEQLLDPGQPMAGPAQPGVVSSVHGGLSSGTGFRYGAPGRPGRPYSASSSSADCCWKAWISGWSPKRSAKAWLAVAKTLSASSRMKTSMASWRVARLRCSASIWASMPQARASAMASSMIWRCSSESEARVAWLITETAGKAMWLVRVRCSATS